MGFVFGLSVLERVGDGRSGTRFSGGGRPAWFSPVFLCHMADKRGVLARGRLYHQFFSFPDPLGGVGGCFLAAVAGLKGISEGNDGGDVSRAVKPEVFRQGSYMRSVPLNVVDLPSPGWSGKGHGTCG